MTFFRNWLITLFLLPTAPLTVFAGAMFEIGTTAKTHAVVTVSAEGSKEENGARLVDALKAVQATTPTLIRLEPGVYDIGDKTLFMKPDVDLEGSGRTITTIVGNASACEFCVEFGVLRGASSSEVRNLQIQNFQDAPDGVPITVVNTADNAVFTNVDIYATAAYSAEVEAVGMLNVDAVNVRLENVKIVVYLGKKSYGIKNIRANATCTHVKISANASGTQSEAYGIYLEDSLTNIENCDISAVGGDLKSYGIYGVSNSPGDDKTNIYWSRILGYGNGGVGTRGGLYGDQDQVVRIFSSLIRGVDNRVVAGSGSFKCEGCAEKESLDPLDADCSLP